MFAVLVVFEIQEAFIEDFLDAARLQAENSLKNEPDCLHFDVLQDMENPQKVTLYEMYTNAEVFYGAHRKTSYFLEYAAATEPWVQTKRIIPQRLLS